MKDNEVNEIKVAEEVKTEEAVKSEEAVIRNADRIFPVLMEKIRAVWQEQAAEGENFSGTPKRAVISISGGSGTGKTSMAHVLSGYFQRMGIGSFILSGDHYPHRIPRYNDAERLRIFRERGMQKMLEDGVYTEDAAKELQMLQEQGRDSDQSIQKSWMSSYLEGGKAGLREYLGTEQEQNFQMVSGILAAFHSGAQGVWVRNMGREEAQISYAYQDVSQVQVLILEWTHGNSEYLEGVDIPVVLKGTPKDTLALRLARNRDTGIDHPFTALVLEVEQEKLDAQEGKAKIVLSMDGRLLKGTGSVQNGPMLNAYPDSIGGNLKSMVSFLQEPGVRDSFQSFYILPSLFNTDLDRGFSVIDYGLNEQFADAGDLQEIRGLGIDLKLDFIMNHASVWSLQFQDLVKNGEKSVYKDFFLNWNEFWKGCGEMTEEGYIRPREEYLQNMFFRKPGLPILMVRFPDGSKVPYWNTFYQKIQYPKVDVSSFMKHMEIQYDSAKKLAELVNRELESGKKPEEISFGGFGKYREAVIELLEEQRSYLGQMDLNIQSPLVWDYYKEVLRTLAGYGAKIVRLDAFAYAPKKPGERNFLNEPGTWELLEGVQKLADEYGLKLLPEIHASYEEGVYETLAKKGYLTYDFFLPGLILDAIEEKSGAALAAWAEEQQEKKIHTVNMLGCHDGIPLLDLKGMIPKERIDKLIKTLVSRGGYVKNLHGQETMYYQVNAAYYSALGEDDKKMVLARAIQMFMPGKPQVWYLDLLGGKNDYEAVKRAGEGGHKEINRTNLTAGQVQEALQKDLVQQQLELLRFRSSSPAFGENASLSVTSEGKNMKFVWTNDQAEAALRVDFESCEFAIETKENRKERQSDGPFG